MTKLNQVFPQDNYFLTLVYVTSMCFVVFHLSWQQFLCAFLIDTLSLLMFIRLDRWLFLRCYPKFRVLHQAIETIEDKQEFFELLSRYPETRSFFCMVLSLVKVAPGGIYIASVASSTPAFMTNLALFYVADFFIIIYFGGLLFVELHNISTDLLKTAATAWGEAYRNLRPSLQSDKFSRVQNTLLVLMLVNFFAMSFAIHSTTDLLIHFGASLICIGRLQMLFQKYFQEALLSITKVFEQSEPVLPLHTSPILSNFEMTVNHLKGSLELKDREISKWIKNESEQFHLKTLGGVTAMVAHDIRTPLHIMKHSYEMMVNEATSEESKQVYRQLLKESLDQSLLFSQTLIAYVKGDGGERDSYYGEVHDHLLRLFKVQFFDQFPHLCFIVSPELRSYRIPLTRLDAMHVFYNLYQNSIKAVLEAKVERPTITVWQERGCVFIKDNGAGLKREVFEKLVSFERYEADHRFHEGLGLRLTNSILEHLGGQLSIESSDEGTCLRVSLPELGLSCELSSGASGEVSPPC